MDLITVRFNIVGTEYSVSVTAYMDENDDSMIAVLKHNGEAIAKVYSDGSAQDAIAINAQIVEWISTYGAEAVNR